jgi:hypothetical protein
MPTLPENKMSALPSEKTAWKRTACHAVRGLMLALCLSAPAAPTLAEADDAGRAHTQSVSRDGGEEVVRTGGGGGGVISVNTSVEK